MTNETTDKELHVNSKLTITGEIVSYLKTTAKWSFFLAIIGYILILLLVITGITFFVLSSVQKEYSDFQNLPFPMPFGLIGVLYLIMGILYFFPSYNLMKFGNKIKAAFENNDQTALDEGLKNLKQLFTFFGVMTIVIISAYIILIPTLLIFSLSK
jgi:H+/Cl- antiporter ClcA